MATQSVNLTSRPSLSTQSRVPFTSARPVRLPASRRLAAKPVAAVQGHGQGHDEEKVQGAPSQVASRVFGAVMAAQMAALPLTGTAMAGLLPDTATSSAARAELNQRTSNLPTLRDVGKSLTGNNAPDVKSAAKQVGKQVGKAAPSASDAKGFVKRNLPNLGDISDLPLTPPRDAQPVLKNPVPSGGPARSFNQSENPFEAGSVTPSEAAGLGQNIFKDLADAATGNQVFPTGSDIGQAVKGQVGSSGTGDDLPGAKRAAEFKVRKSANVQGELSELPNPLAGAASKIKANLPDLPGGAKDAGDAVKSQVGQATGNPRDLDVKRSVAAPDIPNFKAGQMGKLSRQSDRDQIDASVPDRANPRGFDLNSVDKDQIKRQPGAAVSGLSELPNLKNLANKVTDNVPTADDFKGNNLPNLKNLANKVTDNVPTADDFKGNSLPNLPNANQVGQDVKRQVGKVPTADDFTNQLPSASDIGNKAKNLADKVNPTSLGNKISRNTPNLPDLSELPNPLSGIKNAFNDAQPNQLPSDINRAGDIGSQKVQGQLSSAAPNLPSPQSLDARMQSENSVGGAAGAVKEQLGRATPDLPSPGRVGQAVKDKAGSLGSAITGAAVQSPEATANQQLTDNKESRRLPF